MVNQRNMLISVSLIVCLVPTGKFNQTKSLTNNCIHFYLAIVFTVKCYICEFNINYCKDPNCYTNPDICSANQFSSVVVPIQDCPRNCMLKAVTNPAGIILKWKRLCAPATDHTNGFRSRIDYVFGARIEQCTCDRDFCNGSNGRLEQLAWWITWTILAIIAHSLI